MYIDMSLKSYIDETKSANPTPGGGSVSAVAGAMGAALTAMVQNLTANKKAYQKLTEAERSEMEKNIATINSLLTDLEGIVDEDTKAFDCVMEAFKLPKNTDEEKKIRQEAVEKGYEKAMEVPMRCAEKCLEILRLQEPFAHNGNINAITDVGVGVLLAYTGLEGALFNVTINIGALSDEAFKKKTADKVDAMLKEGKEQKEKLLKVVYERLNG